MPWMDKGGVGIEGVRAEDRHREAGCTRGLGGWVGSGGVTDAAEEEGSQCAVDDIGEGFASTERQQEADVRGGEGHGH